MKVEKKIRGKICLGLIFWGCIVTGFAGELTQIRRLPSDPLAQASVRLGKLSSILNGSMLLGNGDINALLYSEKGKLTLMLTKNDVWDARFDLSREPPNPTLKRLKELGAQKVWNQRNAILPKGSTFKVGRGSFFNHSYPCPRACGKIRFGETVVGAPAKLDLRRAVAQIGERNGECTVRALAGSNCFLIEGAESVELEGWKMPETPDARQGVSGATRWLSQRIPGDLDWPGMSFAIALHQTGKDAVVSIVTSFEARDAVKAAVDLARRTAAAGSAANIAAQEDVWRTFWGASEIKIADPLLIDAWYMGLYGLRCVSKPGVQAPGLFASLTTPAPAWHGDYHTNYNIQQTFWGCFAANHLEMAEPYDRLITGYKMRSEWLARTVFEMEGSFYPHCIFAYEPENPATTKTPNGRQRIHHIWAFSMGVSGFTVQPLWIHYKYNPDPVFLKEVAYPAVRGVARFYADFMAQCERVNGRVRLGPTVSPEHWGWTPGFRRNYNSTFDIAYFTMIFRAAIEGAETLNCDPDLVKVWKRALTELPDYPCTRGEKPIVVDVEGAPPIVYNISVPATPVSPADLVTWQEPEKRLELFRRTVQGLRWNGNNATFMMGISKARLGAPDTVAWCRAEILKRMRPNKLMTFSPLKHRYNTFGHYTESFAVTAMISELLIQSVGDVVRLFPAWPDDASFETLRTQGGFLVSAEQKGGKVVRLEIRSTVGGRLRIKNPWPGQVVLSGSTPLTEDRDGIVTLQTSRGEVLRLTCKNKL